MNTAHEFDSDSSTNGLVEVRKCYLGKEEIQTVTMNHGIQLARQRNTKREKQGETQKTERYHIRNEQCVWSANWSKIQRHANRQIEGDKERQRQRG